MGKLIIPNNNDNYDILNRINNIENNLGQFKCIFVNDCTNIEDTIIQLDYARLCLASFFQGGAWDGFYGLYLMNCTPDGNSDYKKIAGGNQIDSYINITLENLKIIIKNTSPAHVRCRIYSLGELHL